MLLDRTEPQLREYRCSGCAHTEHAQVLPEAWYTVKGSTGDVQPLLKLGIYCTPTCVASSSEQFEEKMQAHLRHLGLTDETEGFARAVQDAVNLHEQGWSIAQISDLIQKPAKKVSRWLRIAGAHTVAVAIPTQNRRAKAGGIVAHITQSPVRRAKSLLNELEQHSLVTGTTFDCTPSGLPHQPSFTVLASTVRTDTNETITAEKTGSGRKSEVKEAAAAALIERLLDSFD